MIGVELRAEWVRGHSGDADNEFCDGLAETERLKLDPSGPRERTIHGSGAASKISRTAPTEDREVIPAFHSWKNYATPPHLLPAPQQNRQVVTRTYADGRVEEVVRVVKPKIHHAHKGAQAMRRD